MSLIRNGGCNHASFVIFAFRVPIISASCQVGTVSVYRLWGVDADARPGTNGRVRRRKWICASVAGDLIDDRCNLIIMKRVYKYSNIQEESLKIQKPPTQTILNGAIFSDETSFKSARKVISDKFLETG